MRYLIFTFALMSAFFVSAEPDMSDLVPANSDDKYCTTISAVGLTGTACSDENVFMRYEACLNIDFQPFTLDDKDFYELKCYEGITSFQLLYTSPRYPDKSSGAGQYFSYSYSNENTSVFTCPPNDFPNHVNLVNENMCAKPLEQPEPDPDCPAPTDNDPFVFGSGGGQTSVCFPAPNGRQCEIQTDENGGYYIPASYGSAEPVSCFPDIDPSPDPDPTPDPEPRPDPDPTDPEPEAAELDAINKINENLDVINNNQKTYSESNDERLDRIAIEIQNSNQILSDIKSKPVSSGGSQVNNGALLEIAENTKKDLYNGECEGELCDYDIQPKLDEENAKLKEWIEKEEPAPSILNTYTSKITSYVSQNFSGFTGTCQPFILDVSIANVSKTINVHQHCEPYETYFKPLVEWLLWTFTAIALINISSQAFRAFSSL
jgi:hypothetical protein